MNRTIDEFMETLASKAPVPGGGGASALVGAVSAALCSMVANLTSGKKKYAQYQPDIERILEKMEQSRGNMLRLIQKDAQVFEPLSAAYGIPKDAPGREEIMERALYAASDVPLEIMQEAAGILDCLEELAQKGSRLAVSDVGVAASACRCCLEGAVMNVYINTKLMKDREQAEKRNAQAFELLSDGIQRCSEVYWNITKDLGGKVCGN